jgi:hypothetical protein
VSSVTLEINEVISCFGWVGLGRSKRLSTALHFVMIRVVITNSLQHTQLGVVGVGVSSGTQRTESNGR